MISRGLQLIRLYGWMQMQERLTEQIARELKNAIGTEDVAAVIEAAHMCVTVRGIEDDHSSTTTASYHGKFKNSETRNECLTYLNSSTKLMHS